VASSVGNVRAFAVGADLSAQQMFLSRRVAVTSITWKVDLAVFVASGYGER
jgi:hypothetical protein